MAQFHVDQFLSFQINYISSELLRDHQLVRNLAWECRLPDLTQEFRRRILTHYLHSIGSRNRFGVRNSLQKSADSKPMVPMAMGDVDGCQVLTFGCNPICKYVGLFDRHK